MKREIYNYLNNWKKSEFRKPLLMRGARQVGKTTSVRQLGQSFKHFVEINLEVMCELHAAFEGNLDPQLIITNLQLITKQVIIPGETLLFLDEIQACPNALLALRYFYEMMPALHIIAAGSLLEFCIEKIGLSVGRLQFLYMYPMSFKEFLMALNEQFLIDGILTGHPNKPFSEIIHKKALRLFSEYLAIGGMPEAVLRWRDQKNYPLCLSIHNDILLAYKQDFEKFTKKSQIHYVEHVFSEIPYQLGEQFNYANISGEYRKRELEPALSLLEKANVITKIMQTPAQGFPLAAHANPERFKVMMLDVALTQKLLKFTAEQWIIDIHTAFINKGAIAESFVGQELLAYSNPHEDSHLYYWRRDKRNSAAELDYVIAHQGNIIPVEVKAGHGSTLKSMHAFLQNHSSAPYGIRFSTQNFSIHEKIISYPLYAVMLLA